MRNSLILFTLSSLSILAGCLPDIEPGCTNEAYFSGAEFYYRTQGTEPYLTQYIDQTSGYTFCDELISPPDSVSGISNIYSVEGILVEDCNTGDCIKVLSYSNPFCRIEYNKQTTYDYLFLDEWLLARYYNSEITLHPSCNTPQIRWFFDDPDSISSYAMRANLGINSLTMVLKPIANNQLIIEGIDHTDDLAVPYVKYFEDRVISYLKNQDTLTYAIEGNEMKLFTPDTQDGLIFYQLGL